MHLDQCSILSLYHLTLTASPALYRDHERVDRTHPADSGHPHISYVQLLLGTYGSVLFIFWRVFHFALRLNQHLQAYSCMGARQSAASSNCLLGSWLSATTTPSQSGQTASGRPRQSPSQLSHVRTRVHSTVSGRFVLKAGTSQRPGTPTGSPACAGTARSNKGSSCGSYSGGGEGRPKC